MTSARGSHRVHAMFSASCVIDVRSCSGYLGEGNRTLRDAFLTNCRQRARFIGNRQFVFFFFFGGGGGGGGFAPKLCGVLRLSCLAQSHEPHTAGSWSGKHRAKYDCPRPSNRCNFERRLHSGRKHRMNTMATHGQKSCASPRSASGPGISRRSRSGPPASSH